MTYETNRGDREKVSSFSAATYNLENGKIITNKVEKDSKFCQECGTKIDNSDSNTQTDVSNKKKKNKRYALIGIGYLTVLILLISVLSAGYNVKVINADRILLYPLLSIMMSVYVSLKLISDEKTFKHGVIIPVISFILFIFGI